MIDATLNSWEEAGETAPETEPSTLRMTARFLQRLGIDPTGLNLADHLSGNDTADAVLRLITSLGSNARLVHAGANELKNMRAPALLMLQCGRMAIYLGQRQGKLLLEMPEGKTLALSRQEVQAIAGDRVIEVHTALSDTGSFVRRLAQLLWRQRGALSGLILFTLPVQLLEMAVPLATWLVMDSALPAGDYNLLTTICIAIVLLALHRAWFGCLRDRASRNIDARLAAGVASSLFSHAIRLPFKILNRFCVGNLSQTLDAADMVAGMPTRLLLRPVLDLAFGALSLILVISTQPVLAFFMAVIASLLLLSALLIGRSHAALHREEMEAGEQQESHLFELICGANTIAAAGVVRARVSIWMTHLLREQILGLKKTRVALRLDIAAEAAQQLTTLALLTWGGVACLEGDLSAGAMIASLMLGENFIRYSLSLGQALFEIVGATASTERVDKLLADAAEKPLPSRSIRPRAGEPGIDLEGVAFRYAEGESWVLQGFKLRVAPGEIYHLRGASGCGKTTIMRLVAGLYQPCEGKVRVFGHSPAEMRGNIAYLPQSPHLFAGTIASNLLLLSRTDCSRIQAAAQRTGLDRWIAELPMGYDTVISPGATSLSGGQRQLIALTAMLASQRQLLLLDESLSNIDRIQREQLHCEELFAGKTVLNITHDT